MLGQMSREFRSVGRSYAMLQRVLENEQPGVHWIVVATYEEARRLMQDFCDIAEQASIEEIQVLKGRTQVRIGKREFRFVCLNAFRGGVQGPIEIDHYTYEFAIENGLSEVLDYWRTTRDLNRIYGKS